MSCTPQDTEEIKPKKPSKNKKLVKCCHKDVKKSPKPAEKTPPPIKPVKCKPIEKPPKEPKVKDEPHCEQPPSYKSPAEQRAYLERDVVPILMEGMLGLAREKPIDPITYLEKFWLEEQQKCNIPLPNDLL